MPPSRSGTFGSMPFLQWLDARFVASRTPWFSLVKEQPDLCRAVMRLHHVGLDVGAVVVGPVVSQVVRPHLPERRFDSPAFDQLSDPGRLAGERHEQVPAQAGDALHLRVVEVAEQGRLAVADGVLVDGRGGQGQDGGAEITIRMPARIAADMEQEPLHA